jgi:predicted PurR-regulated permease PerM
VHYKSRVELRIPFLTLLKIALAVLLIAIVIKLWPIILMVIIGVLIAVMLDPVVLWLEAHRVRQAIAVGAIAFIVFGLLLAFLFGLLPVIGREVADVSKHVPPLLQRFGITIPQIQPTRDLLLRGFVAGKFALAGLTAIVFVLVVSMYLLLEGRQVFSWLITFAPRRHRSRIDETAREMSGVVLAYMRGNVITSVICALYVLAVLSALQVPLTLLLAVIAFVFDFVPVVGTIAMTVPAALLALTVSPLRALIVVVAYLVYHLIENYVIIPRVYGTAMRLSTLTVILAITVGGTLQGVIGAVIALPIAAAYPIIERIWLRDTLPSDTVERHEELQES